MLAFAIVIAVGFAIGAARGGSLANVTGERLGLLPLVWAAAGMQIGAQFVPADWNMVAYALVIVSYAALFAFAGANWRIGGMLLIGLGAALNYAVILLNQGMPISARAAAEVGITGEAAQRLILRGKHFIATGDDATLQILGDIIPLWRQPAVASIGDLIIWAGMIIVVQALMQPRGRIMRPADARRARRRIIDLREGTREHEGQPS